MSHASPAASAPDRAPAPPLPRSVWVALAVLTLINLLNYLDRYIVPAVQESIKQSPLAPTDTQLGLLVSGFLVVYMIAAPPFGRWGDRGSRPRLLAAGIAIWSVATALGGLAPTYGSLLVSRAAVGIGEAAYATIAPALLADYFPERLRGRVFAVFFMATPVGAALGYIVGGVVDRHFGWRHAFFVAGVPGLLLALATLFLRDPPRGAQDAAPAPPREAPGFVRAVTRFLEERLPLPRGWVGALVGAIEPYLILIADRAYLLTILGYAAYTFAVGGISWWMPSFLARVRGLPLERANVTLGGVLVVTGFAGTFAGGWIADWLQRRVRRADLWVCGASTLLALPLTWVALASARPAVYWSALVGAEVLLFASTSPVNAAIVGEVPPAMRASAMALCIFVIHALGDVPAPTIIGTISDASSLAHAVMVIPVAVLVGGLVWCWAALRPARAVAAPPESG